MGDILFPRASGQSRLAAQEGRREHFQTRRLAFVGVYMRWKESFQRCSSTRICKFSWEWAMLARGSRKGRRGLSDKNERRARELQNINT